MTEFQNKSFSVYPGGTGGQEYRDNWDRVFGRKEKEPEPTVEPEPLLCEWCGADYFECICTIRI